METKGKTGIILVLGIGLCLGGGCAKKAPPLTALKIATGGSAGTYYAYGSALGRVFENKLGLPVTIQSTAAAVANIALIQSGRTDFAFVQNDVMTYAYYGTNIFSSQGPQKDFSAVAGLYPEVCHIVALEGVAGIVGLKGLRVSVGEGGSGTALNAEQILEIYGMTLADLKAEHLNFSDSVRALIAGEIDGFFCTAGTPTPALTELASSARIQFLPISEARRKLLIAEYPYYTAHTIPGGTYPGIEEDVNTLAVQATLVAHNAIQAEDVYKVTRSLFEGQEEITAAHPKGAELSLESAVLGIPVPFHPGALKYYREQGILK
ncbi:MAG: TAXI family TRAP transporter solute-binding subunit [Spirochaetaceae bacterium]|jgi:TRAP transporter TAXI family solute receptor|nr:TAXI family TRAP transporter solute-binding subunit [Spirochaetaceae bacterium]